jgi:hypothetical protein
MSARVSETSQGSGAGALQRGRASADCWRLEPHVCAVCFARVASCPDGDDGDRLYRCTNCGVEAVGHRPAVVCACGLKLRRAGANGTTGTVQDAGIRCHENLSRSPEVPALFVASYGGAQAEGA